MRDDPRPGSRPMVPVSGEPAGPPGSEPRRGASGLQCREMAPGEESAVYALVMRGFDESVRQDFSVEGTAEFERAARSFVLECPDGHRIFVAVDESGIVGMLDVRDASHIALFFVDATRQRCGVGRALLDEAFAGRLGAGAHPRTVTVNSSPRAVPAYERLGFTSRSPVLEQKGIRFVRMERPA